MSGEAFIINDPPGTFRVLQPDGATAFDSRLATQRIHMIGQADVTGPANGSIISTTVFVPYGKTYPKIPYVRSAARLIDTALAYDEKKNFWPPRLTWSQLIPSGQQFYSGGFTHAVTTGVYLGSAWQSGAPLGRLRFVYAVFENPVEN